MTQIWHNRGASCQGWLAILSSFFMNGCTVRAQTYNSAHAIWCEQLSFPQSNKMHWHANTHAHFFGMEKDTFAHLTPNFVAEPHKHTPVSDAWVSGLACLGRGRGWGVWGVWGVWRSGLTSACMSVCACVCARPCGSDRHTFTPYPPMASRPPSLPGFPSRVACSHAADPPSVLLSEAWIYNCLPSHSFRSSATIPEESLPPPDHSQCLSYWT